MFVKQANIPDTLPLLPVKDAVLFPNMVIPILVKTESFVPMLEEVMDKDKMVIVAMMSDEEKAALEAGNFSRIGTVASLVKMSKGSEGSVVVVQGLHRAVITGIVSREPNYLVHIQKIHEEEKTGKRVEALKSNLINVFKELVSLSPYLPEEILNVVRAHWPTLLRPISTSKDRSGRASWKAWM
jgi:ATP-dependent Lon protease